jgi:hypothetical protein
MSQEFVRNLAVEQRKRLVGSLMEHLERNVYPVLTPEQRTAVRQKVLSSVGAYHDFMLDVLKASVSDGSVTNDVALELLEQINRKLDRKPALDG